MHLPSSCFLALSAVAINQFAGTSICYKPARSQLLTALLSTAVEFRQREDYIYGTGARANDRQASFIRFALDIVLGKQQQQQLLRIIKEQQ